MLASIYSGTFSIGAIVTIALVLALYGVPIKLIRALRDERDFWRDQAKEVPDIRAKLAAAEAKTDLSKMIEAVHELASTSTSRHERFALNLEANSKLTQGLVRQLAEQTSVLHELVDELKRKNGH